MSVSWSILEALRKNPELIRESLRKRGMNQDLLEKAIELDLSWRKVLTETNKIRESRNRINKQIPLVSGEERRKLLDESKKLAEEQKKLEEELEELERKRNEILMEMPNLVHESVPEGPDERYNVPIRYWGVPKVPREKLDQFIEETGGKIGHVVVDWEIRGHADELEEFLSLADTKSAGKVAGARFFYLLSDIVWVDLALQLLSLDLLTKKGFIPVIPPYMMKEEYYKKVTDLQTFRDAIYKIENEDLYLIATSEHPIAALHAGDTFREEDLPKLYAGISPCFRKEAGTHGKDTKGIFRVHQFTKVEQFVFCLPEESWEWHEKLIRNAEEIYQLLEIPYRVVNIAAGDLGGPAAKKYDIEAWFPSQGKYREVVSCSNVTDWQSYRLNIKVDRKGRREYVHTLNSTAMASTRTISAIIENHQREDGSVEIPKALRTYLEMFEKAPKDLILPRKVGA
ncbi:MAG: serine--tRNA ligase [Candidatus Methanodesulfokora washburnensis]|jgi:seryl-tRNA synthetase